MPSGQSARVREMEINISTKTLGKTDISFYRHSLFSRSFRGFLRNFLLFSRMDSTDYAATISAMETRPMALLFGPECIVAGKRVTISSMGPNYDRVNLAEAMRSLFPSMVQIIVWKNAQNEPISIENLTFPEIEAAIQFRARGEASNVFGDQQEEYNNLKAQFDSADEVEKQGVLQAIKELMYTATLNNLAANALKSFGTYYHEEFQLNMCLLDYRQLFSMDQSKIGPIQNRINRALARASLPSTQEGLKLPAKSPRSSKKKPKKKVLSSSSSEDSDSGSSSTISYPVEGKHTTTDEECQSDGNATPVVFKVSQQESQQSLEDNGANLKGNSYSAIPKKSKKSKTSNKGRKQRVSSKPGTKSKSKKAKSKKDKQNKRKKARKSLKKQAYETSSESDQESPSESESEPEDDNSDQVL